MPFMAYDNPEKRNHHIYTGCRSGNDRWKIPYLDLALEIAIFNSSYRKNCFLAAYLIL
jgi:hypothetical protein